jgi:hypothetical protein
VSTVIVSNSPTAQQSSETSDDISQVFVAVFGRVSLSFVLASVVLFLAIVLFGLPVAIDQAILITLGSGLFSLMALVPGWVIGRSVAQGGAVRGSVATVGVSAAIAIRFAGTVALFVACRYHFGEESLSIVFLVIGWYVFLTSIEVHGLARGLTSLDHSRVRQAG